MAIASLSPADIAAIQKAQARLQAGDAEGAEQFATPVARRTGHPEAGHMLAFILSVQGRAHEALEWIEDALNAAQSHAPFWLTYGRILGQVGGGPTQEAIGALRQAVTLSPNFGAGWAELGEYLFDAGRMSEAEEALMKARAFQPNDPHPAALLGLIRQADGNLDSAIEQYRVALALRSDDPQTRHNLAEALRAADQSEAALAEIDSIPESNAPPTLTLRGHLLADLGKFDEAIMQYDVAIAANPGSLDALETQARLLPQLGQAEFALDCYRTALKRQPGLLTLWHSAIGSAHAMGDAAQLMQWAMDAEVQHGPQPAFALARATALGLQNDHAAAREIVDALLKSHPDDASLHAHFAHILLCLHDPKAAEAHALAATRLAPHDQTAWAHLTIIWRLLSDAREAWLADYERFVMPVSVELPEGLAETLAAMHALSAAPAEQSLRGGTQTRGNLFDRRHLAISQLVERIKAAAARALADLPVDGEHPFLSRNRGAIRFAGSWSVRLKSEGFHINHIHPQGWLSSALYVALPEAIDRDHGGLAFGIPEAAFGLDLPARRIEVPEVGKLVLFPSYFWHGTLPFTGTNPRMSIAFDALPDQGRRA